MNRYSSTLLLIALILGSTLGCARIAEIVKKSRGENPPVPESSQPEPGRTTTDKGENSLAKKTNLYVKDCYNKYSNSVIESFNRYSRWVKDLDQGPSGRETLVYGLYNITGDGSDCEKAVESAKGMEPPMPELDTAADEYVIALKEAVAVIRDIYPYYEQQDYKDDNFAKGKAAHAGLMSAYKRFRDANKTFHEHVDKLEDSVAESELARLNDAGSTFEALVVETGIKAKAVKNLIQDKEFDQIKADDLNPLIEDFGGVVERLKAARKQPSSNLYVNACDEFSKASKEMMRRIRDGKKFTDTERRQISMGAGWMVEGSPQKLLRAYNDMIQRRSMARF